VPPSSLQGGKLVNSDLLIDAGVVVIPFPAGGMVPFLGPVIYLLVMSHVYL